MHNEGSQQSRYAAGTAADSQAPGVCLAGALLLFLAVFQLMTNSYAEPAFVRITGTVVVAIWIICMLGLFVTAGWASSMKKNTNLSLADLMPARFIGGMLFGIAVLASLLLGI